MVNLEPALIERSEPPPGLRAAGDAATFRDAVEDAFVQIEPVLAGRERSPEPVDAALFADAHLLIEGVPGPAQTQTVKTVAAVLGGEVGQVQSTPDLVPADPLGTRIDRPDRGGFDTELGPVFRNALLAEEINRVLRVGPLALSSTVQPLLAPPTDRAAVPAPLDRPRPGDGTAMGDATDRAVEVADGAAGTPVPAPSAATTVLDPASVEPPPTAIFLLAGAASTGGRAEPAAAVERTRDRGRPVVAIACGTADGVLEQDILTGTRRVPVPPDEATPRDVAETTGGRVFAAPSEEKPRADDADLAPRFGVVEEERALTVAFAGGALLFLTAGRTRSLPWFNRFP